MAAGVVKNLAKRTPAAASTKGQRSLHTFFTKRPSNGQISSLPATDSGDKNTYPPGNLSKKFVQSTALNVSHLLTPAPSSDAIEYHNEGNEAEEPIAPSSMRDRIESSDLSTPPALNDTAGFSDAPLLTSSPPTRVRVGDSCLFVQY